MTSIASSAACRVPRFGSAWPCSRTRSSRQSASCVRRVMSMISGDSGLPSGMIGSAESTSFFVSERRNISSRKCSTEKQTRGSSSPQPCCGNACQKSCPLKTGFRWYSSRWPWMSNTNASRSSSSAATDGSTVAVGETLSEPPRGGRGTRRRMALSRARVEGEHRGGGPASRQEELAPRHPEAVGRRRAEGPGAALVSRRTGGSAGSGSYSPFEHGPNSIGSPGSSSRQSTRGPASEDTSRHRAARCLRTIPSTRTVPGVATYEYLCMTCEHRFEERRPMAGSGVDTALACPTCGSDRVRRRFSMFATTGDGSAPTAASGGGCCGGGCACGS